MCYGCVHFSLYQNNVFWISKQTNKPKNFPFHFQFLLFDKLISFFLVYQNHHHHSFLCRILKRKLFKFSVVVFLFQSCNSICNDKFLTLSLSLSLSFSLVGLKTPKWKCSEIQICFLLFCFLFTKKSGICDTFYKQTNTLKRELKCRIGNTEFAEFTLTHTHRIIVFCMQTMITTQNNNNDNLTK